MASSVHSKDAAHRASSPGRLPAGNGTNPFPERQSRLIAQYIEVGLHLPLRVGTMAALSRMSISYFGRRFTASFACPPHAYIIRARIERAKKLLLSGTSPLVEIALCCGFADQAHLSRMFLQQVGETPGAWQRRRREPTSPHSMAWNALCRKMPEMDRPHRLESART